MPILPFFAPMGCSLAAKRKYQPVTFFVLTLQEQQQLEELSTSMVLTSEGRRAQALLWLAAGQSTQTVAHRLHVSRQTVYNWMASFRSRSTELDLPTRLADKHRSGRPRTLPKITTPLLRMGEREIGGTGEKEQGAHSPNLPFSLSSP